MSRRDSFNPVAKEIPFDPTGTDFDSTVKSVDDALRQLDTLDLKTLTEFEAYQSPATQSTTSDSLVVKTGYPYTTTTKSAGVYVIDHTAEIGQGSNNRESRHTVEWRPGTTGTWITLVDISAVFTRGGDYELRSGFNIIELVADGVFQVRFRFANPGGGSCLIREANIKIGKVSDEL